jgi:hypothetical protein
MTSNELFERLPLEVRERVRPLADRPTRGDGRHVVYWMHHAVRGHENPALDAAILVSSILDRPLLVYQGLGRGHRFNNDRHHTFILEGARDARAELAARGVSHALWLADGDRPSPLAELAASASLVVTEDFPAPPFPRWTAGLAERISAPVWAVDTACIVPMRLVEKAHDRAFRFRKAVTDLLDDRVSRSWVDVGLEVPAFDATALGFDDVKIEREPIADLVARCAIDHTVGPVGHTPGGSVAGYERWHDFRTSALRSYAARRNNAADLNGVSRLSPYLHHGHVSPFRIAREAAEVGGKGADKFLDELLIWRELAHNLCFHRHAEVESLAVLPSWAGATLEAHADDPREAVLSWESLARGRSGDELWDLCQQSLVRHGELHNNLRMTWGKAIPRWTDTPETALAMLLDLNHRFALDGSDPNSYGGLLWCLGLFDRPFEPEQPVLGSVRPRSTEGHAKRLDVERYASVVGRSAGGQPLEVGVIGAGLSGLMCARTLVDHGHAVQVFEKGRGPGGRMSRRREGEWQFDHGAQYFTVRDGVFRRFVESWQHDGVVDRWQGRIAVLDRGSWVSKDDDTERYVGVPGMNAVCAHLAGELDTRYSTRVDSVERADGRWQLVSGDEGSLGSFDALVVSAPAPQTATLLENEAPAIAARAAAVDMAPCWAVMAVFDESLNLPFDGAFVADSPLSWVARNASKPERPGHEAWVLHGSPQWSRTHLELDAPEAAQGLLAAFAEASDARPPAPAHLRAHRWRFALPVEPRPEPCLFDRDLALVACGDWCAGPRVEGAYRSGAAAAGRLLSLHSGEHQLRLFAP